MLPLASCTEPQFPEATPVVKVSLVGTGLPQQAPAIVVLDVLLEVELVLDVELLLVEEEAVELVDLEVLVVLGGGAVVVVDDRTVVVVEDGMVVLVVVEPPVPSTVGTQSSSSLTVVTLPEPSWLFRKTGERR